MQSTERDDSKQAAAALELRRKRAAVLAGAAERRARTAADGRRAEDRRIATRVLKPSTRYYPGSTDAISPPLTLALARGGFRWPWAAVLMLGGGVTEM